LYPWCESVANSKF